jgi:hypothetical protein
MGNDPDHDARPYGLMAFHAVLAGAFFFGLNRFALGQSLDASLVWALVAAPFAAYLAYMQSQRK